MAPTTSLSKRSSITARALEMRAANRRRGGPCTIRPLRPATVARRRSQQVAPNYSSRVLAGEFEPTAVRARDIATARGVTLHQLAYDLGYAHKPPATARTRSVVDLSSITRSALAAVTGYAISDISRTLARRHPPTLTKLAKIAKAYDALMDDVLAAIGW